MNKKIVAILIITCVFIIGASVFFGATPVGRSAWNNWFHAVQKADDNTRYATRKQVEDTCRAMIASYNSDAMVFEQYKNASGEKSDWADQAKMRANKTASTYNNYILQNSYVWENNVPLDIRMELPYIQ